MICKPSFFYFRFWPPHFLYAIFGCHNWTPFFGRCFFCAIFVSYFRTQSAYCFWTPSFFPIFVRIFCKHFLKAILGQHFLNKFLIRYWTPFHGRFWTAFFRLDTLFYLMSNLFFITPFLTLFFGCKYRWQFWTQFLTTIFGRISWTLFLAHFL